jgi:hypothetical protein
MRIMRRKIPTKKEKLKKSQIKPNFVETEYDLSYLSLLGVPIAGLLNPTPVRVFEDGTFIILNHGKAEEW